MRTCFACAITFPGVNEMAVGLLESHVVGLLTSMIEFTGQG